MLLLMLQSLSQFLLVPGVASLLVLFQGVSKFELRSFCLLLLLFLFALPWMMSHASISVSTNGKAPSPSEHVTNSVSHWLNDRTRDLSHLARRLEGEDYLLLTER